MGNKHEIKHPKIPGAGRYVVSEGEGRNVVSKGLGRNIVHDNFPKFIDTTKPSRSTNVSSQDISKIVSATTLKEGAQEVALDASNVETPYATLGKMLKGDFDDKHYAHGLERALQEIRENPTHIGYIFRGSNIDNEGQRTTLSFYTWNNRVRGLESFAGHTYVLDGKFDIPIDSRTEDLVLGEYALTAQNDRLSIAHIGSWHLRTLGKMHNAFGTIYFDDEHIKSCTVLFISNKADDKMH